MSVVLYRKMGFLQIVDTPHYARFESQEGESTFSLTLNTLRMVNPTVICFEHEQLDELVISLRSMGFVFSNSPRTRVTYGLKLY